VYKELELGIEGLKTEEAELTLQTALKGLQGIHAARMVRGGVHVTYNPLGITPQEIRESVRRAGFAVDTSQGTGEA
jgi:hypothetical protein